MNPAKQIIYKAAACLLSALASGETTSILVVAEAVGEAAAAAALPLDDEVPPFLAL